MNYFYIPIWKVRKYFAKYLDCPSAFLYEGRGKRPIGSFWDFNTGPFEYASIYSWWGGIS